MNKQKKLPPFPKVGLSGTQYDKDAYSKLKQKKKLEEGFTKDPDVVYHCAMDDIKYIDDYAQINGIKVPIAITKYNMLRSCSSFTYRSDLVVKEALSVSIKPSVIQEGTTATLVAKFNGKEVEAVYTTDSELIEINGSTVSVKKDAAPGSAIINATYTKPAITDEENTEIEPAKEFTAKVTVKVTAIPVTKPTININGTEPTIFAGGTATISVTAVKGNKHDITEVKLDDGTALSNTSGNVYETTVTPTATKTYTVIVKDAGSQTATIKIKVTVKKNVLVINGSNPTSADGTTTLTAMLNGEEAPSDTTWEITGEGAKLNETTGSSVTLTGQNTDTASSKTVTITATTTSGTTSGITAEKTITIPAAAVTYYMYIGPLSLMAADLDNDTKKAGFKNSATKTKITSIDDLPHVIPFGNNEYVKKAGIMLIPEDIGSIERAYLDGNPETEDNDVIADGTFGLKVIEMDGVKYNRYATSAAIGTPTNYIAYYKQ